MNRLFRSRRKSVPEPLRPDGAPDGETPFDRGSTKLGLLKMSELFRDLSEEQMGQVDRMTVMVRCDRGRTIFTPNEPAKRFSS